MYSGACVCVCKRVRACVGWGVLVWEGVYFGMGGCVLLYVNMIECYILLLWARLNYEYERCI